MIVAAVIDVGHDFLPYLIVIGESLHLFHLIHHSLGPLLRKIGDEIRIALKEGKKRFGLPQDFFHPGALVRKSLIGPQIQRQIQLHELSQALIPPVGT